MDVQEGALKHGLPYLAVGEGRPLVFLRGLHPVHANAEGFQRKMELKGVAGLARHYRVHLVGRGPGLAEGATMADIATQHAEALADRFTGPVDVLGVSSGGSVALQLAADHPEVVRRLVVAASGCTLGPDAKRAQLAWADAYEKGRRGLHHSAAIASTSPVVRALMRPLMWAMDPLMRPADPTDMIRFIRAEDGFDVGDRLAGINIPTLVIGGDRDAAYPVEIFRRTATGIPGGALIVYPRTGHVGSFTHKSFASDVQGFLSM
ncbi:alpha/beta fold hydrolase [Spirillospora sp. CA-253888]